MGQRTRTSWSTRRLPGRLPPWRSQLATHLPGPRRVLVRNMANPRKPGGGVKSGAGAQEEDLFRRSDLHRFLAARPSLYPLSEGTGLLSRGVTVFRGVESEGFPAIQPFQIDVLTFAAPAHPRVADGQYLYRHDALKMREVVRQLLGLADQSGCQVVLFSAFGCGAFGHPPIQVAQFFRGLLSRPWCSPARVWFCIIDDHNAHVRRNPDGNFGPFSRALAPDPWRSPLPGIEVAPFGAFTLWSFRSRF